MKRSLLPVLLLSLALATALPVPVTRAQETASGRIVLTLIDSRRLPVVNTQASFIPERGEILATCRMDASGRCVLVLPDVPTDPSGFIRGSIQVDGHGRRPVLWPGGTLELALQLDEGGQLAIAHDLFVTRTPLPSTTPPTTGDAAAVAGHRPSADYPAEQANRLAGRVPEASPIAATNESPPPSRPQPWLLGALIVLLLGGTVWYAYRSAREGLTR